MTIAPNHRRQAGGSTPTRGQVRETGKSRYYIEGPPDEPTDYVVPMLRCVEVEGRYKGHKYTVPVKDVETWRVVSEPVS